MAGEIEKVNTKRRIKSQKQNEVEFREFQVSEDVDKENPLNQAGLDRTIYSEESELERSNLLKPIRQKGTALIPNPYTDTQHPSYILPGPIFSKLTIAGSLQSTNFQQGETGWRMGSDGLIEATRINLNNFTARGDDSIVYAGSWSEETVNVLFGGGRQVSSSVGDTFTITFYGSSIGVIMEKSGNLGKVDFSLDGGAVETVDLYQGSLASRTVIYQKTGLRRQRHTLIGTVATKNASSSGNTVGLQGYVKSPTDGIRLEDISADLFTSAYSTTTNSNGYQKSTTTGIPSGWDMWNIAAFYLTEADMDNIATDRPKLAYTANSFYFYDGAASTSFINSRTIMISKLPS